MDTIITSTNPSTEPPDWQIIALSEQGPRAENQDNYLVINGDGRYEHLLNEHIKTGQIKNWPTGHIRLAIADGMGGHNNGRQASEALVQALINLPFQNNLEIFREEIISIHNILFKQFHQGAKTPGSTLVMADINNKGKATIINIGDSRAYISHAGQWKQLTKDHTEAEFAWRDGELSDEDYYKKLQKNTNHIVQAIGYGSSGIVANKEGLKTRQHRQELRIEISQNDGLSCQLNANDVLLLASDGVWSGRDKYVPANIGGVGIKQYAQLQMTKSREIASDNITLLVCALLF